MWFSAVVFRRRRRRRRRIDLYVSSAVGIHPSALFYQVFRTPHQQFSGNKCILPPARLYLHKHSKFM